ncbi:hypothetical protein [Longitalea arenae]|uniref:hypothetical protein n=1 Tax=Longitalea arenae TaxID=2812558 RepID=UPI001967C267|nr:hypothetical protein [Longitalea arenae]
MGKSNDPKHVNKAMNESIAKQEKLLEPEEAIKKMQLNLQMAFIDADAYASDPFALLGQVFQIRKNNGKVPTSLNAGGFPVELTPYPLPHKVNEKSKTIQPLLRSSLIVDQKLAAGVSFLNYLSAELSADSSFSVIVFDQASGTIDMQDSFWVEGIEKWMVAHKNLMDDPEICYLFAVTAFIQKNIVRKKYKKFTGKTKGGAWGVNINGELSTSTEEYSLDIKFGLTPIVLKRPSPVAAGAVLALNGTTQQNLKPTREEMELFRTVTGFSLAKNKLMKKAKKPSRNKPQAVTAMKKKG